MNQYSNEAEEFVLSTLMNESQCLPYVTPILKPECFYSPENAEIYRAILNLDQKREQIDLVSVNLELKKMGRLDAVGGPHRLAELTSVFSSQYTVEQKAMIVYEFYIIRKVDQIAAQVQRACQEPKADAPELLNIFIKQLSEVHFAGKSKVKHIGDAISEIIDEQRKAIQNGKPTGHLSGLSNLDRFFSRQKQDFGIIAARPGMGKTAFVLTLAKDAAKQGKPVAIFSLEMSTTKLVGRLMASEAMISSKEINEKSLDAGKLMSLGANTQKLAELPIYFDDTPAITVTQLRSSVRRMVDQYGIQEVFIDYLQLMHGDSKGNREQEISYISRSLKKIAKEENIPVVALSQLSREVEKRPGCRPQLSDLRESGAIEQDADWVLFLYRPEYYGIGDDSFDETFNGERVSTENLLVVDCGKYRDGSLFKSALKFYGEFMLIADNSSHNSLNNNNEFL